MNVLAVGDANFLKFEVVEVGQSGRRVWEFVTFGAHSVTREREMERGVDYSEVLKPGLVGIYAMANFHQHKPVNTPSSEYEIGTHT